MIKLCQRVLDGKGMSKDWKTSVMVPIYKGKGDVTNCSAYTNKRVKLLEHGMKIIERVLEKRIKALIYTRKRDNRCSFYSEKNGKGIHGEKIKNSTCFL